MVDQKLFSVWVGGAEVNDYYLTGREAIKLAAEWLDKGYEDIAVELVFQGEGSQ